MVAAIVQIPAASRVRLEALARAAGQSVGLKLTELIELACSQAAIPSVDETVRLQAYGSSYAVDLFEGEYRVALTRDGIRSLASDLLTVADDGGSIVNRENGYVIRRSRRCVVLEIDAFSKSPGLSDSDRKTLVKLLTPRTAQDIAIDLLQGSQHALDRDDDPSTDDEPAPARSARRS